MDFDEMAGLADENRQPLNTITNVVKQVKAKAEEKSEVGTSSDRSQQGGATETRTDWSVLRSQLEALCGDILGRNKSGSRGKPSENFNEFIRRFRRKYQRVVMSDQTLIEILGDDHLGGRAKCVFQSIPVEVKSRGFDQVVDRMHNLLSEESVAGRMRAVAELHELSIRPGQDVAEFCVALEKLGRKAYPEGSMQDRSLEFAQILLSNLKHWPEHVQLLSVLHKVQPERAYDEVEELALSIELSRKMYGPVVRKRRESNQDWKMRSRYYRAERVDGDRDDKQVSQRTCGNRKWLLPPSQVERENDEGKQTWPREAKSGEKEGEKRNAETRKCFNCSKFGHIGKDCPQKRTQVKQIVGKTPKRRVAEDSRRVSEIIIGARSLGMKTASLPQGKKPLVGRKTSAWVRLMNDRLPAMLDTGSMISIVPVGVLARAKEKGFNVDSLEVIARTKIEPVYDASNNRMEFLGAVKIPIELEGGKKSEVAFHIADSKANEVLLGTNALDDLGVSLIVCGHDEQTVEAEDQKTVVTVSKRVYLPPHGSAVISARCEVKDEVTEGIVWTTRRGVMNGVYKIQSQELDIPIINESEEPMVLKEGEELGHWGTEKWKDNWEELNPLMLESEASKSSGEERQKILENQIKESSNSVELSSDIKDVLVEYSEAFAVWDTELTGTKLVEMDINTGDNKPLKMKARPVPLGIRKKLRTLLEDLENRQIIEKSSSEWAFPIVLVEKKDGSLRLCVDYRELNKRIKQDSYPLPTLDAVLQSMSGKRYFSTLDLCSGYWQIPLSPKAREKSAFTTPEGLFQFRVTPFGLSTSPAVLQKLMDTVLHDLLGSEVFCYIDDIMICTDHRERHIELLRRVCSKLQNAGLQLKAKKCVLLQERVSFLGHVIDRSGLHMDPTKVEAIRNYPTPRDAKALRTFLGMASFYRKFCLGFSKFAGCLFALTSPKSTWNWTEEHGRAFAKLKKVITSAPVLMQPDIEKARDGTRPFVICTDASTTGLGAVLSQEADDKQLHPVYFASKGLSRAERRYHVTDLEALAVIFAVRRFHMFIYGLPTTVLTDHQPLTALFKRSNVSARVLRWSLEVQRYNLEIRNIKGKTNAVADALSRGAAELKEADPIEGLNDAVVNAISTTKKSKWLLELEKDHEFELIVSAALRGEQDGTVVMRSEKKPIGIADFIVEDGDLKLYKEDGSLVYVVPKSARYQIFHEAHAGTFAAHFNAHKLYNKLKKEVFWPSMIRDISKWTRECQRCFVHNPKAMVIPPLKPIVTGKPYEVVGVDILELGLTSSGNRYVVSVIDHFSKFAAAYPVADKTAETVARTLFVRWIAEGCRWPKIIISDKGGEFENRVMEELTKVTKIEHVMTKGYNPRENGITERLNGTIVAMLRRSTVVPTDWDVRLPFCMMAYNMTPHRSTGESPYFVLHGMDPYFPSAIIPNGGISWYAMDKNMDDYRAELLQSVSEAHERIKEYNDRVREKMKRDYDHRNEVDTRKHPKVGDRVYVRSPNEKALNSHPKLVCEWAGPFRVLETSENSAVVTRIGENAEPIRIQFDMLRVVPSYISDDRIDTITERRKRGRKPGKTKVCQLNVPFFSGAALLSPLEKGHLLFKCGDGCFDDATLQEIEGCRFPGAVARKPITTIWEAWLVTSIFRRQDLDLGEKIKLHREGAICFDAESLKHVLRMAYKKCIDWTDFLCNTKSITQHAAIDGHYFDSSYDEALKALRADLEEESVRSRPKKTGPIGYAAGAGAMLLEKDGQRGEIVTKMVTSFDKLLQILEEWTTFSVWVVVWPIDRRIDAEKCGNKTSYASRKTTYKVEGKLY